MPRELYWLVVLEAACFFSFPAWELASLTFPLQNPRQFAIDLLIASVIATLVFHVGPAFFVHRFDRFAVPAMGVQAVRILLGVYCLEWLGRNIAYLNWPLYPWLQILAFPAAIVILAQDCWRRMAAASLGLSLMLLTALLWINWPGLWITSTFFTVTTDLEVLQQQLFSTVFLSSAWVIVVAGRIGKLARHAREIWFAGLLGVATPLLVSLTMSTFAAGAGARLRYKPSLPIDFSWAWGGYFQENIAFTVAGMSLGFAGPLIASCWSLGALFRPAANAGIRWAFSVALPIIGMAVFAPLNQLFGKSEPFGFSPPFQELATKVLFAACTVAGLAALLMRPRDRLAPSPATSPDVPPSP